MREGIRKDVTLLRTESVRNGHDPRREAAAAIALGTETRFSPKDESPEFVSFGVI